MGLGLRKSVKKTFATLNCNLFFTLIITLTNSITSINFLQFKHQGHWALGPASSWALSPTVGLDA